MVTLSGAQTLADLKMTASNPQMTAAGAQQTQQTQQTFAGGTIPGMRGPTGTRVGSDEATVMERNLTASSRPGSDEATVMERFGGTGASAESTVLEQKIQPGALSGATTPKRNVELIAAIAAIVVLLVVGGIYFATRKPAETVATTTVVPSGTDVTTTAVAPMTPSDGLLLLSATPWGDIDRIVSTKDNKEIAVEEDLSTPARIALAPGQYDITLVDERGRPKTVAVTVAGGKPTRHRVDMGTVNYDELYREVTKP
jgi:hypothetical protein